MKIHELLSRPGSWCQRDIAKDADGKGTYPTDEAACSWCIIGAFHKCYPDHVEMARVKQILYATTAVESLVSWNDDPKRTQTEIVDACRRAGV